MTCQNICSNKGKWSALTCCLLTLAVVQSAPQSGSHTSSHTYTLDAESAANGRNFGIFWRWEWSTNIIMQLIILFLDFLLLKKSYHGFRLYDTLSEFKIMRSVYLEVKPLDGNLCLYLNFLCVITCELQHADQGESPNLLKADV